jgi:PRTRC genetic system protein B
MMKNPDNTPTLFHPAAAIVVFRAEGNDNDLYLEHYDMDENGCPLNPRPLSVKEAQGLAKALDTRKAAAKAFLKPKGLLPSSVLHLNPAENGSVVWYTKPQTRKLYFSESLGLASCELPLPALVWAADKSRLAVFALIGKSKPRLTTPLYNAPFFNLYHNGNVCMGSVDVRISQSASLEEFTAAWEGYFFGSYFSHFIGGHTPVKGNLISLYQSLAITGSTFPVAELVPNAKQLKHVLR